MKGVGGDGGGGRDGGMEGGREMHKCKTHTTIHDPIDVVSHPDCCNTFKVDIKIHSDVMV